MMGPRGKSTKLIVKKKLFSISVTLHRFECIPIFVISEKVLRVLVQCFVARVPNDYKLDIYTKIKCLYRERIALFGNGRKKKNNSCPRQWNQSMKLALRFRSFIAILVGVYQTKFRESNNETRLSDLVSYLNS